MAALLAANPNDGSLDVLIVRSVFGGGEFPVPVLVDEAVEARLRRLRVHAPLAAASTAALIDDLRAAFPTTPIALVFETSFFVGLPARETTYALPAEIGQGVRRWGYHGLFHDAATAELAHGLGLGGRPARMLSVCLDPRPELTAVRGRQPLLVTSGSTPIEGLPGEYSCGEIDPAIALALAADPAIGPERANLLLTRESGFFGMLGYPATLGEVLTAKRARIARVREHLLYQMMLATGSSLAALEGLDGLVFSGRHAEYGDKVAAQLVPHLEHALDLRAGSLPWRICRTPIETIAAEAGMTALLAARQHKRRWAS
jgi:acetate kinase